MYLHVFNLIISSFVIILHIACILVLWRYDKMHKHCFIISILLSEMCYSLWFIVRSNIPTTRTSQTINVCLFSLNIPYCGCLIFLTLERYLEVYLHIKYYSSLFYNHRLKLCIALWVLAFSFAAVITVSMVTTDNFSETTSYMKRINIYFLVAIHAVILLMFLTVYIYLYKLFKKSQNTALVNTSKVFAPFFIVLTFICFLTVPMAVHLCGFPKSDPTWVLVLNRVNSITDGVLYVLLNPTIRKKLCMERASIGGFTSTTLQMSSQEGSGKTTTPAAEPLKLTVTKCVQKDTKIKILSTVPNI